MTQEYPKISDLDISSKEKYLEWVAQWKESYRVMTALIREAKTTKRYHRDQARIQPCANDSKEWHRSKMTQAITKRESGRWRAHEMLEWRAEGKKQSWAARCKLLGVPNIHAQPSASGDDSKASQEDLEASQEDNAGAGGRSLGLSL